MEFVIYSKKIPKGHFKGMEISLDNSRSYPICRNCPQSQLKPDHIFYCKAILAYLFKLDASPQDMLSRPDLVGYWGFWTNIKMH
ncbi:hypothetical protein TNCT_288351 [Trichonephila clavata]|uniref:Uncharacterized protein n=1 Tax=Trichonephila clavata TaxID=2740835 RepID=A0A8X6LK69_TRICU|nr:hypothetical protein TNCT_288351 [Trichonephila clavata]